MYYFCTYFDINYLSRGLALYRSLKKNCPEFHLWILCMDHKSHDILTQMALPNLKLIALEDFEKVDEELLAIKSTRSVVEYYFTCTPSLPLYVLNNFSDVDLITYLDADLYFFSDIAPIYEEISGYSIAIIEHRFPPHLLDRAKSGIYNVGWISFKRDKNGFNALNWWRERCLEWCYDRVEDKRCADQKYLDDWLSRFDNVIVLQHKGVNVAPWNIANYAIHCKGESVWIDDQPLIFYHFHGFKQLTGRMYDTGLRAYKEILNDILRSAVYEPYLRMLLSIHEDLTPFTSKSSISLGSIRIQSFPLRIYKKVKYLLLIIHGFIKPGNYIVGPPK